MSNQDKEGIKLTQVIHAKCRKMELIDYYGYIWCEYCQEIVNPEDILDKEEGNV